MVTIKRRPLRNQKGASAIEYALVVALVALAIVGALGALQGQITTFLGNVGTKIAGTSV